MELFGSYHITWFVSRFVEEIKRGHIKGAVNIPLSLFIDSGTKQMKSADVIRAVFKEAGVDLDTVSIVATCGRGELCNVAMWYDEPARDGDSTTSDLRGGFDLVQHSVYK